MSELTTLIKQFDKTTSQQDSLRKKFKNLLNKKTTSFDQRLKLWDKSPAHLKVHYTKAPATKNKMITQVLHQIRMRLNHAGRKIDLSTGLMDDLYIYEHDEFAEAIDSASHLKTKKEFITFMEYVFKHNLGSFEYE